MADNRVSLNIPASDLDEIRAALKVLKTKLMPHLIILTAQERKEMARMGDKSIPFVKKGLEWGQKLPAIVPVFI